MATTAHDKTRRRGSHRRRRPARKVGGSRIIRVRLAGKRCDVDEARNWGSNEALVDLASEKLLAGDWVGYIYTHPEPLHLECFWGIRHRLTDKEYWRLLGKVWDGIELPGVNRAAWLYLFTSPRPGREHLMSAEERARLDGFPDRVQIYRGAPPQYARGLSWTTSPEIAQWFARRFNRGGLLHMTTVPKAKIIGYLTGREEFEVIIDPRRIRITSVSLAEEREFRAHPGLAALTSPIATPEQS